MIRHIVFFKIKEDYKDKAPEFAKEFRSMKGRVSELVELEIGEDFLHSPRSCDMALVATLKTREDLDAYQVNPIHVAIKTKVSACCESIAAVDYEF